MVRGNPDVFAHFQTPSTALGITYLDNYDPKDMDPYERQLVKEMHLDPAKVKGHIALGPEATAGDPYAGDTIHHELIHYALARLRDGEAERKLKEKYYLAPSLGVEDIAIPLIMIREGRNVERNKQVLEQLYLPRTKIKSIEEAQKIFEPLIKDSENEARKVLKERYGKKK